MKDKIQNTFNKREIALQYGAKTYILYVMEKCLMSLMYQENINLDNVSFADSLADVNEHIDSHVHRKKWVTWASASEEKLGLALPLTQGEY